MSTSDSSSPNDLRVERAVRIDRVCREFEAAWKRGERPPAEAAQQQLDEDERADAACELVGLECDYRLLRGEQIDPHELRERFPEFESAKLIELCGEPERGTIPGCEPQLGDSPAGRQSVQCPQCRSEIAAPPAHSATVVCGECGSAFELREIRATLLSAGAQRLGRFELIEAVGAGACGTNSVVTPWEIRRRHQ